MINGSKQVHKKLQTVLMLIKFYISRHPSAGEPNLYFCRGLKLKPKAGSRPEATTHCIVKYCQHLKLP